MEITNLKGELISITSLYTDRRIVCVFLRHLSCRFCWQQVHHFNQAYEKLASENIQLVCISAGTLVQAQQFVKDTNFKGELYIDQTLNQQINQQSVYQTFNLLQVKDFQKEFSDSRVNEKADNAIAQGFQDHPFYVGEDQQWAAKNISQLGGVFVLGVGNTCDYSYVSRFLGDYPAVEDVLNAAIQNKQGQQYIYNSTKQWDKKLNTSQKASNIIGNIIKYTYLINTMHYITILSLTVLILLCLNANLVFIIPLILGIILQLFYLKNKKMQKNKNQIKLYTAKQIDEMLVKQKHIQCNCPQEISQIEMFQKQNANQDIEISQQNQLQQLDNLLHYAQILCYLREFLAKPNENIGRKGPTCPFVPSSLKMNSIYISVIQTTLNTSPEDIKDIVEQALELFEKMPPFDQRLKVYKTFVLIFPNIPVFLAPALIDGVQQELKAQFIKKGLMIGEFHKANNSSGLRNPNFFPLRTPVPCLAIRHMVASDIAFMTPEQCDNQTKIKFLEGFIQNFSGDHTKFQELSQAKDLLLNLKRQI